METRIILEKNVERNTFDNVLRTPLRGCDHSLTNPSEGRGKQFKLCNVYLEVGGGLNRLIPTNNTFLFYDGAQPYFPLCFPCGILL